MTCTQPTPGRDCPRVLSLLIGEKILVTAPCSIELAGILSGRRVRLVIVTSEPGRVLAPSEVRRLSRG